MDGGKYSDVRVGAFVLVALAILIAGSLWVVGSGILGVSRDPYTVLMADSGGLQPGDRVRVAGVAVGRIRDVQLRPGDEWPVTMDVLVRSEVALGSDASARIATPGMLGTPYLQIEPGTRGAPPLEPGGVIRAVDVPGFDDVMAEVDELSDRAKLLLDQISTLVVQVSDEIGPLTTRLEWVLSEDNAEHLGSLLATLDTTLGESGPRLTSLLARLETLSVRAEEAVDDLPGLTDDMSGLVEDARSALGPDGERLARTLDAVENGFRSADGALATIGGSRAELDAAIRDLRDTAANLRAFSRTIKERPYSMVRMKLPPDRKPGDDAGGEAR